MDNEEIRERATRILYAYLKEAKPKTAADEQFVEDVAELAINVLVNASQSTAQLIFGFLQSEPTPRDAAATLAAVHAALIWTQEQENEDRARKLAQEMVDGIVLLWKANRDAQVN